MFFKKISLSVVLLFIIAALKAQDISDYNVVWNTQSQNSSESMPLGGGDIGCNVWVENNDLLIYIARSGTFDENNSMLKLGRVRISLSTNPFKSNFRQELKLKQGYIEISGDNDTHIKLWVEVFKPVIHIEITSGKKFIAKAAFETWRTADRSLSPDERHQAYSFNLTTPDKLPLFTRKDTVNPRQSNLVWYHKDRNDEMVIDKEAIQQHLNAEKDQLWNPLKDLMFGGEMIAKGMAFTKTVDSTYITNKYRGWVYQNTVSTNRQNIDIVLHTSHSPTTADWLNGLHSEVTQSPANDQKWAKNVKWWAAFWGRSYIFIDADKDHSTDKGWEIGRNYNLFRYQLGCNAYGEYPTKFNGGLFTFDPDFVKGEYKNGVVTPDFRRWGGGSFTAQNQRLVYWPMLKSGDFDMMKPQFEFYRRSLGNAELRTKVYWGHGGASFTEQVENFGLPAGHTYEKLWGNTTLRPRSDSSSMRTLVNQKGDTMRFLDYGDLDNIYVVDHYDGELEFSKMILDYQLFTGADISQYMPFIESSIRFHDEHFQYWSKKLNGYPLDANGKLIMYPGTALETYKGATNSTTTISAMKSVLDELLALPANYGTPKLRAYWRAVLNRLPEISTREKDGFKVISPARSWTAMRNVEFPQMYPVFPYGLYGVGLPGLQLAIDTWHHGADKKNQYGVIGWKQDPIWVARLGLTTEAKNLIIQKLSNARYRYFTFWGPGFDWAPDHNWGGSGMIALQEMAMQTVGKKIYLLPAWPKDWDADIKLHAPYNTTVEAIVKNGKVEKLKVTPLSRTKDVVVVPPHD
jgi:hypothetical protein